MKCWTADEIDLIVKLRKYNRNFYYIANYFNVTPNAVRKVFQRYHTSNLKPRKPGIRYYILKPRVKSLKEIVDENKIRIKNNLPLLRII